LASYAIKRLAYELPLEDRRTGWQQKSTGAPKTINCMRVLGGNIA
jgi:hypothetical protein